MRISLARRPAIAALLALATSAALVVLPGPAHGYDGGARSGAQADAVARDAGASGSRVLEAADRDSASRIARAQGSRVEVTSQRTEYRQVFAEPKGGYTLETSLVPRRVHQGSAWVAPDRTLVRRADGTIAPRAAVGDLTLSSGGGGPLVRYVLNGAELTVGFPRPLPAPSLAGDAATYPDVLPGVDLVVRAEDAGYRQELIVKTAAAAADPGLETLAFPVAAKGATLRVDEAGNLRAVDAAGKAVLTAPAPTMWDSSAPSPHTAPVGLRLDRDTLTLHPDRGLLTSPDTKFPVVIDPDAGGANYGWAMVQSGASLPHTSWGDSNPLDSVGRKLFAGKVWGTGSVSRSVVRFDLPDALNGAIIYDARLENIVENWASSCTGSTLEARQAPWIDGGTTWDTLPSDKGSYNPMSSTWVTSGGRPGCGGDNRFGLSVKDLVTGRWSGGDHWVSILLAGADENDQYLWKKFDETQVTLRITYDYQPDAPNSLSTDPPLPAPCRWCGGVPWFGDSRITMKANVTSRDPGAQLSTQWDVWSGGAAADHYAGPSGPQGIRTYSLPLAGYDGKQVSWWVKSNNGSLDSSWVNSPTQFHVEFQGVSTPPTVRSSLYPSDNAWHGGANVPGPFTFGANGAAGIDHYLYGWQDPPSTPVNADALGGDATVSLTPPGDGPRDLYVQSVNRSGHRSPTTAYHFYVRPGNGPRAQWSFEGDTKDSAYLGSHDGTLNGAVTYAPGAVGNSVLMDGSSGYVSAPNTVRTDTSFTVSAWVRLAAADTVPHAVLSQDGAVMSGLDLWYRPENGGHWVFGMSNADDPDHGTDQATSAATAQPGVWTHLTGVYDAPNKQLRLYVNGSPAGKTTRTVSGWNAGGSFRVGQTKWKVGANPSYFGDFWSGGIDEVKVFDRALPDADVAAQVGRDNVQVGYWKLDDDATDGGKPNTTARDTVPGGADGVLTGGASFTPAGPTGPGLSLDGSTGFAATNSPVLRTDGSFTVSAWVSPTRLAGPGGATTALSQEDNGNASAFYLGQRGSGWSFLLPRRDESGALGYIYSGDGTAQINQPTHLVGVYDATAGKASLYVNGQPAGTAPVPAMWNATGTFLIGRAKTAGKPSDFFPGTISQVRAYSRAVNAEEVRGIVARENATLGAWKLNGDTKDASGRARDGVVHGGVDYTAGRPGVGPDSSAMAAKLNGTDGWISAPHVVDTDHSFSVTAWARLDRIGGSPAVLSEDGAHTSAFQLQATPDGHWAFVMFGADADGGGSPHDRIVGAAAQPGVWTHLVGVYDAGAHQLSLYVNGALTASGPHLASWNTPAGGLQIGRAQWNSAPANAFPGSIAEVAAYNRPLFADEIATLAGRDLSLVHRYAFDESSGTAAADAVGTRTGTLAGGASFAPGRVGNAVSLDGKTGAVGTTGVDLRTDQSFTVTAWVYLTSKGTATSRYTAVSLDGAHASKFRLGYVLDDGDYQNGAWVFEMNESDTGDPAVTKPAAAPVPFGQNDLNTWVHLTGVYDKPTGKLWLYVNATRIGDGTLNNAWQPGGGLQIGRALAAPGYAQYWPGSVDDVRLYTGALDKNRIAALYGSYPPAAGPTDLPTADAGWWKFDEHSGTTAADASGHTGTATLKNGATWIGGRSGSALWNAAYGGYAETAGPAVRTDQSFTAAGWFYLADGGNGDHTMLGQDGNRVSAFLLQYRPGDSGRWAAVLPSADQDGPPAGPVLLSAQPAVPGRWTHLALAYDAGLHQARLYVNGELSAARVGVSVLPSTGPLSIGRARSNGAVSDLTRGGVDEVRMYSRALSDGEVRRIHDDVPSTTQGLWTFDDGTAADNSSHKAPTTTVGTVSYTPGAVGQAVQLNGTDAAVVSDGSAWGVRDQDTLTLSAWAKLGARDHTATVLGQDGDRTSGLALQYRADLDRWVFGAATADADGAPMVFAGSLLPPALGQWTHLVGVYDYPARQLRLYVNGTLVGSRDGVNAVQVAGAVTVGRGKTAGQPANFFPGALDEARWEPGMPSDAEIARRAAAPAPTGGQLGRFVNPATGDHYTASTAANLWQPIADAPGGYRFDATLGALAANQQANTKPLFSCWTGADEFTSPDPACEGQRVIGQLGFVYTSQPANVSTVALYRCDTGPDHFESRRADCEGAKNEMLLGYTLGYAPLDRYVSALDSHHISSVDAAPPGYRLEGAAGLLALTHDATTRALYTCRNGSEQYPSADPACEGKTVVQYLGEVWTAASAGLASTPIYRCVAGAADHFVSIQAGCEGTAADPAAGPGGLLGYVLTAAPTP